MEINGQQEGTLYDNYSLLDQHWPWHIEENRFHYGGLERAIFDHDSVMGGIEHASHKGDPTFEYLFHDFVIGFSHEQAGHDVRLRSSPFNDHWFASTFAVAVNVHTDGAKFYRTISESGEALKSKVNRNGK